VADLRYAGPPTPVNAAGLVPKSYVDAGLAGKAPTTAAARIVTAATTLVLADAGNVVELNTTTTAAITIPPNSSVAFVVGTVIEFFQLGAGQLSVAAGTGVTIRTSASLTARAQYATLSVRKRLKFYGRTLYKSCTRDDRLRDSPRLDGARACSDF